MEEKNQNRQVIKNLQEEYEKVQKATTDETLNKLFAEIGKRKEAIEYRTQQQAQKDIRFTEQYSNELMNKAIKSNAITRISLNKENGNLSMTVLKSFVIKLMSVTHKADIQKLYNEKIASDLVMLQAFNRFVQEFARVEKDLILANL